MRPFLPFLFFLLPSIAVPQRFSIDKFGAKGDGKTLATAAIQRTIDACAKAGGGTVMVPPGTYLTGTLHLRSNITMFLDNGAHLKGSPHLNDYETYQIAGYPTQYYGILFTENAENIAISGMGEIDGNDSVFMDWKHAKKLDTGATRFTRQKASFRATDGEIGDGPVVPASLRPHQMVIFSSCRNVQVTEVSLLHSPFWTLHFADCDGVKVHDIRLWSHFLVPNADGIDVTSCTNVNIANCDIRTGDDAIAITGYDHHFEIAGFKRLRHPSGNIVVTNCNLQSYSSGIRIGWLDQNTVSNIQISNINITNSTRGIGIFLRDEGSLENIHFTNISIETVLRTGDWWGNGEPIHISAVRGKESGGLGKIRNLRFDHINCRSEAGILLYGIAESMPTDIRFNDVMVNIRNSKLNDRAGGNIDLRGCLLDSQQLFAHSVAGIFARDVDGLVLTNCKVSWDSDVTAPFFSTALCLEESKNIRILNFEGNPSPGRPNLAPISLFQVAGVETDVPKEKISTGKVPD